MEEAVCWHGDGSGPANETTPGGEQPVETTGCRSEPGQDDVAGCATKKVLNRGASDQVEFARDFASEVLLYVLEESGAIKPPVSSAAKGKNLDSFRLARLRCLTSGQIKVDCRHHGLRIFLKVVRH